MREQTAKFNVNGGKGFNKPNLNWKNLLTFYSLGRPSQKMKSIRDKCQDWWRLVPVFLRKPITVCNFLEGGDLYPPVSRAGSAHVQLTLFFTASRNVTTDVSCKKILAHLSHRLKLSFCDHRMSEVHPSNTGPCSAGGNMSGNRCESDCRSRGHEFDTRLVPYFRCD